MEETNSKKIYYNQNIGSVWSYPEHYTSYEKANWRWGDLPFSDNWGYDFYKPRVRSKINNISILEVGSAMGGAYKFIKNSNLVSTADYTGVEVSDTGYKYMSSNLPEANWIHADFTKYDLNKNYDYSFERISVHHMHDPLGQYNKILKKTNIAASFSFRGCIRGNTTSDLNKACFFEVDGKYYCNIINIFEVLMLGLDNHFNDIRILYGGPHEPFIRDEQEGREKRGNPYVSKDLDLNFIKPARFQVRFRKNPKINKTRIYCTANPKTVIYNLSDYLLILRGIKNLRNFINISKI